MRQCFVAVVCIDGVLFMMLQLWVGERREDQHLWFRISLLRNSIHDSLLPTVYCLLPMVSINEEYRSIPKAYINCLLPTAHCLLLTTNFLLPTVNCLLPTANCLLLNGNYLLPTAYCLLLTANCLLPTAYCIPCYIN